MDKHLGILAKKHLETKFVKVGTHTVHPQRLNRNGRGWERVVSWAQKLKAPYPWDMQHAVCCLPEFV